MLVVCFAPRVRRPLLPTFPVDFNVYYSAAQLVRHGQASLLYKGADTGVDPQKLIAAPGTPILQEARAEGLGFVGLYLYPPILADLLLPLTFLHLAAATRAWYCLNIVLLLLTAAMLARILRVPARTATFILLLLSALCFTPSLQCLTDGQITIALLALWTLGVLLYQRHKPLSAGAVFALAAAIKLTPAIVLLPFLIWRRWRALMGFGVASAVLILASLWINSLSACATYVQRVLPAMSGAIPYATNYSLSAATQRVLLLFQTGAVAAMPSPAPPATVLAGRIVSLGVLCLFALLLWRRRHSLQTSEEALVLGLLALLAPVISPVSWFHAYATAFLAFALLWWDALTSSISAGLLLLLLIASLCFGTALSENVLPAMALGQAASLSTLLQLTQLLVAASVVCYRLYLLPRRGARAAV